jgi:hypothetical protein
MKRIAFLLLFVCIHISVNAQESWKSLTQDLYSIKYPSSWTSDTSKSLGVDLILYSEQKSAEDNFTENINVLIQDLAGYNMDLDKYTEISKEQIKPMIQTARIIISERVTSGSEPYHRIVYLANQGGYKLKFEQHYYVKNKKAFVLTLTCEKDQFDNYKTIAHKIFKSFQLK